MNVASSTKQLRDFLETKKGKTYFISIITLITLIVSILFAVLPATISITDRIAQNSVMRDYLAALVEKEANLKALVQQEIDYEERLTLLNKLIPEKHNDEFLTANLYEMSRQAETRMLNLEYQEGIVIPDPDQPDLEGLVRIPVKITLQGNLENLEEFVRKVETFPQPLIVDEINYNNKSIVSQDLRPVEGEYLMILDIFFYLWPASNNG